MPDNTKALAILFANALTTIFVGICLAFGFRSENGALGYLPDHSLWLVLAELVVIILALLASSIAALTSTEAYIAAGADPETAALQARVVITPSLRKALLYAITIGSFATFAVLVQLTGGILVSPFNQFLLALIVLAPNLMSGRKTPYINMFGGLLVYGLLLLLRNYATPLPKPAADGVHFAVTASIVFISVGFLIWTRRVQEIVARRKSTLSSAPKTT